MWSLRPCSDSSATPSFPSQPEGKIGLPRANPRGRLRSPSYREKIKAGRSPFLSYGFSVDNLSWSLRSGELCSGAPSQDPGSRPPLGHRRGTGAGRGRRALRRAEQGSQAILGAEPRAATRGGDPRHPPPRPRFPGTSPAQPVSPHAGPRWETARALPASESFLMSQLFA